MRPHHLRLCAGASGLAAALLAAGCSWLSPRTEVEVGRHRVSLRAPRGFLYVDQGFEKRFRQEATFVDVTDLGPIAGPTYAAELAHAREHWQASGTRVGYEETTKLLAPRALFVSQEDFELQGDYRRKLVDGYKEGDPAKAEANYQALLELLGRLPRLGMDEVTALALERVEFRPWQDEVVSTEGVAIDGRPARLLRTWTRLTHQGPQRYAFVVNGGSLLGVETSGDRHEASSAPLGVDEMDAAQVVLGRPPAARDHVGSDGPGGSAVGRARDQPALDEVASAHDPAVRLVEELDVVDVGVEAERQLLPGAGLLSVGASDRQRSDDGQADADRHGSGQRTRSGAGFTPAQRRGGLGGAAQHPPEH